MGHMGVDMTLTSSDSEKRVNESPFVSNRDVCLA
jgi:hypothetical protein